MAIPSEYSYLLETVDFIWRNTQIYAIASGKLMRYYSSSYNICYQPANECSFLSYNEQSSSFQDVKMIASTIGSIHITDNGGTITVSYDNFKLNFWSEYNQKWIEWIEPDGTYGDYLEVPHTGSWKTSQTVDFRNFQTSFNSLSDACNYIYCNFKHCYIYYNNELWVNPNPPEAITSNGGGATHIAKVTGQLKDLSSNLSDILIVSGGGGGGLLVGDTDYSGKEAGGISGSGDNSADQSTGNAFGQGESGTNVSGGGSGLYGGYKGTSSKSGGAGSGYIGNSLLSNKKMVGYNVPTSSAESTKTESVNEASESPVSGKPKIGNGFARIKFLRALRTMTIPTDLSNYETLPLDVTSHDNPFPYTYADGNMLFWGKRNKKPLLYDSEGEYYYFEEGSSNTATRFAIPLEQHQCINISLRAGCWNAPTEYTTLYIYLVDTQLEVMSDINWMNYNNPTIEQNLPWQSYANFNFDFNNINADYILFGYGEGSIRFKDLVITYYE